MYGEYWQCFQGSIQRVLAVFWGSVYLLRMYACSSKHFGVRYCDTFDSTQYSELDVQCYQACSLLFNMSMREVISNVCTAHSVSTPRVSAASNANAASARSFSAVSTATLSVLPARNTLDTPSILEV